MFLNYLTEIWDGSAGRAHWELLLRARAVETQCFVIAAAQAGVHNHKRESYGHSLIIDPWGDVVAKLEDPLDTGIAAVELDFEKMHKVVSSTSKCFQWSGFGKLSSGVASCRAVPAHVRCGV